MQSSIERARENLTSLENFVLFCASSHTLSLSRQFTSARRSRGLMRYNYAHIKFFGEQCEKESLITFFEYFFGTNLKCVCGRIVSFQRIVAKDSVREETLDSRQYPRVIVSVCVCASGFQCLCYTCRNCVTREIAQVSRVGQMI